MGRWKLWFALLLLPFCTGRQAVLEHRVKTVSKAADVTPVCTNKTMNAITMIVCKIQTERGENCSLLYRHGEDFKHKCDSRFTLKTENQTVFLHLTNVTSEDSGNYTCECVHDEGTNKLHLSVTVEEFLNDVEGVDTSTHSSAEVTFFYVATGSAVCIIISGVILGLVYSKKCHRRRQAPIIFENTELYTQTEPIEPYDVFMQTENLIYDL